MNAYDEGVERLANAIAAEMNSTILPGDPNPVPVAANHQVIRAAAAAALDVLNTAARLGAN